jgi:hypothetical protein
VKECQNNERHCHGSAAGAKDDSGAAINKIMIGYYGFIHKSTSTIEIKQTDSDHECRTIGSLL